MVEMRESNGLTSLESKDLKFETWSLELGFCDQNVTIYPVCIINKAKANLTIKLLRCENIKDWAGRP